MILSKSQLVNNINSEISDQSYGQISPYDIRHNLLDIIDSVHNLTSSQDLTSLNLATFADGNTKVGQLTLENIALAGYSSQDNTAIGYSALKSNYQSIKNTAVGSYSLSCNIYGQSNVAIGYNALAGNTVGNLNVGLGSYTLHNNKSGNGNIAIGHGAGYYVDKNTNNKLFIAYHPIDGSYICSNPNGSGLTPLVYGDLSTIQLGIGVKLLHPYGKLQIGGDVTPSGDTVLNLGHPLYNWKNLYLSNSLIFSNTASIGQDSSYGLSVKGILSPTVDNFFTLGQSEKRWSAGYFRNLVVDGTANINNLVTINTQNYSGIYLYLGTNSVLNPIYSDAGLIGGGLILKSTNSREYALSYYPPSSGMPCFVGEYEKSTFRTNTSFQVPSTAYIQANSFISYNASGVSNNDCYGLFFNSGITYISRKNILGSNPGASDGVLAGIGNVNFLSNSGELTNYVMSVSSIESGVSVSQRFLTGTKIRQKDSSNNNKDKLSGFEIKYIDDSNLGIIGPLTDRLVVGSYDRTSKFVNGLVVMKNDQDGSVMGVTNIASITENVIPKTIFNVRSSNNCIGRFTSENNGNYKAAIQLLARENCEASGVEIAYLNNSGIADVIIYKNSNATNFIRMKDINEIGILSSGITNATITIGHSGIAKLPVISLKDSLGVGDLTVNPSGGYGKLYNLRAEKGFANQCNSLYFMDGSGNSTDLVVNKLDNVDGRAVYVDGSGNTFAGYLSPSGRKAITRAINNNISYGYQALYSILSGSGNLAIGYDSLYNLSSGNNNIVIGESSASGLRNTSNNIIIGNKSFNKTADLSNTSGNIIIGHNIGASQSGSYQFLLGNRPNVVLLEGRLGPNNTDKFLSLPSSGRLYINNHDNTEGLCVKSNLIEVIDSGGSDYPQNDLRFRFIGNNSSDLLILNHDAEPLYNTPRYAEHIVDGDMAIATPYAELNGDLRLRGYLLFSDRTTLTSASGITHATLLADSGVHLGNSGIAIANSGINLTNSMFIEGYMPNGMSAAPNLSTKTSGILIPKDINWANSGTIFIMNRDTTSVIHSGAYVIAARVNDEYKPIWVSASDTACVCCNH
jgi:hypothetical protein